MKKQKIKSKNKVFRVELQGKQPLMSFVDVEAKDSAEAFQKVHKILDGKTVRGIFNLRGDIRLLEAKNRNDLVFSMSGDPSCKIAHISEE